MNDSSDRKKASVTKESGGLKLTAKEEEVMCLLWSEGPMFVKDMLELIPEPKPHFNTVSTVVRGLEARGYVTHKSYGGSYRYEATVSRKSWCRTKFGSMVKRYFNNSYLGMVSALVEEDQLSVGKLRELLDIIEDKGKSDSKKS